MTEVTVETDIEVRADVRSELELALGVGEEDLGGKRKQARMAAWPVSERPPSRGFGRSNQVQVAFTSAIASPKNTLPAVQPRD